MVAEAMDLNAELVGVAAHCLWPAPKALRSQTLSCRGLLVACVSTLDWRRDSDESFSAAIGPPETMHSSSRMPCKAVAALPGAVKSFRAFGRAFGQVSRRTEWWSFHRRSVPRPSWLLNPCEHYVSAGAPDARTVLRRCGRLGTRKVLHMTSLRARTRLNLS